MQKVLYFVFALYFIAAGHFALAMSSNNYQILWDNFNQGGGEDSSSTNYGLHDTLGDQGTGVSSSTNFQLSAGYRVIEEGQGLGFTVRGQTSGSSVAFTAYDNSANTVTVSSASGFSVGDYIAVIENTGFAELVAVGRISSIGGTTITVDDFDGDGGSISAIPAGGDDVVYRLGSNAAAFGTVSAGAEHVSVAMTSVASTVSTGYSVYISANQLFQNASAQVMTSVTDGTVSTGSEEYGAEVTGATAFGSGTDTAVSTTQRVIQTSAAASGGVTDKVAMIYKLSILSSTNAGSYSQNVYYTLTPNY